MNQHPVTMTNLLNLTHTTRLDAGKRFPALSAYAYQRSVSLLLARGASHPRLIFFRENGKLSSRGTQDAQDLFIAANGAYATLEMN
jgi:hypothetical protein